MLSEPSDVWCYSKSWNLEFNGAAVLPACVMESFWLERLSSDKQMNMQQNRQAALICVGDETRQ